MKKVMLCFMLLVLCFFTLSAQRKSVAGFSANLTDFSTPDALKGSSINNIFEGGKWSKVKEMDAGFSIYYFGGISSKINYSIRYNGVFGSTFSSVQPNLKEYYNELEGSAHAFLLKPHVLLNPFITAGIGIGNYWKKNGFQTYVPLGVGLQINLMDESYFFLQANYRRSLNRSNVPDNIFYSLGVAQNLIEKKEPKATALPVDVIPMVSDKDGDGVEDSKDKCPDQAGDVALHGCPDRDGDRVADIDDHCPGVAGHVRYFGCPIPDKDKDGLNDENDKCPDIAGVVRYNGCPVPDSDGDGVNDEEDRCPNVKGNIANSGCPEIKKEIIEKLTYAVKNIYFNSGSAQLQKASYKTLDEIAEVLKNNAELIVRFEGHTDNSGDAEMNLKLSEERANAVKMYIVDKGVSSERISSSGFGEQSPIADNKTVDGRKINRRVEIKLSNH